MMNCTVSQAICQGEIDALQRALAYPQSPATLAQWMTLGAIHGQDRVVRLLLPYVPDFEARSQALAAGAAHGHEVVVRRLGPLVPDRRQAQAAALAQGHGRLADLLGQAHIWPMETLPEAA